MNGLCAIRGTPHDFSRWVADGAVGWSYDDVLPAFRKLEDDHQFGHHEMHGTGGPIPIYREPMSGWGGVDLALAQSCLDRGFGWDPDHNSPEGTGVAAFAMNIRDGVRVSTNDGYLEPVRDRGNLHVRGGAHVDRVRFDRTGTARGVVLDTGEAIELAPGGEVLLAAGAVHSPAVLVRSGIGPEDTLDELGLPPVQVLPVGSGVQDHAVLFVELGVVPEAQRSHGDRPTNAVLRYSSAHSESTPNDMMLMASNHNYWFGLPTAGVAMQLNQALSRGELRVRSGDPHVSPELDLRLLDHPADLERMTDAVELVAELVGSGPFRAIRTAEPVVPRTREAVLDMVKDVMHVCGSARMGAPDDPRSVVDPRARVLGTTGLRVVDASIMPAIVSANLNLTVIAMAEHAAAFIAGDEPAPLDTELTMETAR